MRSRSWKCPAGNLRTTFTIDPQGVVARVIPKVTPRSHDGEVLAATAAA